MAKNKEVPEGVRVAAFKFAVDSEASAGFEQMAESHAGGSRRCFNWCIQFARDEYQKWVANGSVKGQKPSVGHQTLRNAWNAHKNEVGAGADVDKETGEITVWWAENSKQVYDAAAKNAARAYTNWWNPKLAAGPPRRKKKGKAKASFTFFEQVKIVDYKHIQLPKIGVVKIHESLRKLIAANPLKIGTTTVSKDSSGRWFISMTVWLEDSREVEVDLTQRVGVSSLGIDLGVKTLATVCNDQGEVVWIEPNHKELDKALIRLRRAEKALARSRNNNKSGFKDKGRYQKKLRKKQLIHSRVRNLRRDQQHKFTTRIAADNPDKLIVVEKLHVKGMVRNRKLAKAVSQCGFGEIRRQVGYKGTTVLLASRWFASSKTCSQCRTVKDKLFLSDRVFKCGECGFTADRDVNAATNLARLLRFEGVGYTLTGRGHRVSQERKTSGTALVSETLRPSGSTLDGNAQISNDNGIDGMSNNVQ